MPEIKKFIEAAQSLPEYLRKEVLDRYCHAGVVLKRDEKTPDDDEFAYLEGKAVTFNDPTILFKDGDTEYKEQIDSNSFTGADVSDVVLKYNHESAFMAAARTKNQTLFLEVRQDGVYIRAKCNKKNRNAMDFYEQVREGLLDKMSFAFTIKEDSFNEETHTFTVRQIDKVYDVAGVDFPAYENTSLVVARRALDVETFKAQVEARKLEATKKKILIARASVRGLLN